MTALAEEAARLAHAGHPLALVLERGWGGVRRRPAPPLLLPLLLPLAEEAWREAEGEGKRPVKVEALLSAELGVVVVEVFTAPPPGVERKVVEHPVAREAARALALLRIAEV